MRKYPPLSALSRCAPYMLVFALVIFLCSDIHAQIAAVTSNRNLPMTNTGFSNFEVPVATDAVQLNTSHTTDYLQVTVATTPVPGIFWDNSYTGPTGSQTGSIAITTANFNITGLSAANITTILVEDVVLTKPSNSNNAVAIMTCRLVDNQNLTHIVLLKAMWQTATHSFTIPTPAGDVDQLDVRSTTGAFDWLDRASISTHENGGNESKQEIFVVWQKQKVIYLSEGFYDFGANSMYWYHSNINIFPGRLNLGFDMTFKHPDISRKTGDFKAIVAVGQYNCISCPITGGYFQDVVAYDFQSNEVTDPVTFFSGELYRTNNRREILRTPRTDQVIKGAFVAVFNSLDYTNQKSYLRVAGLLGSGNGPLMTPFIANQDLENLCINNSNFYITGSPAISEIYYSNNHYYMEIAWQQVAGGSNNCRVQVVSRRYVTDVTSPNALVRC